MKKLDIYIAIVVVLILLLILFTDPQNLLRIVIYLAIVFGLYFAAYFKRLRERRKDWDISNRGLIFLICGHVFITMLFIASRGLDKTDDWVVSVGEFILYISLMVVFSMLVICKCVERHYYNESNKNSDEAIRSDEKDQK